MRTILVGLVLACALMITVHAGSFGQDMLCQSTGTDTRCATCYDGAYVGADGRCVPCTDPLCLQCTHNGACDVSTNVQYVNGARYPTPQYPSPGPYVETDNTGMPELLSDQCMVTEGSACSTCGRGYYSNGVSCSPCAAHCDVCNGAGDTHCTVAEPGWSLNGGSALVPCFDADCYECDLSDNTQCLVCNDPRDTPTNCVASLHYGCYDATNPSGTCNACAFPFYGYSPGNSDGHKCTVCPPGCAACSDVGDGMMSCDFCVDGWDTITGADGLVTCGVCATANCSACMIAGAHNTETCTACDEFSNLNSGECDSVWGSCAPGCIYCDTDSGYCTGGDGCRDGYAPKQTPTNDNDLFVYQCVKINHCVTYNQPPNVQDIGVSHTKNFIAAECNACEPGYGLTSSFAEGAGGFYFNARTQCDSCDNVAGMTPAHSCGACHREFNANGAWGPVAMICDGCKPGFYLTASTVCTACPDTNCATCDRAGVCSMCAAGFTLNEPGSSQECIACTLPHAAECRQDGLAGGLGSTEIAVRCIDGYGLRTDSQSGCSPCANGGGDDETAQPYCLACIGTQDENAFRCGRCNTTAGYYLTDDGKGCQFCVEGCRDCYNADTCAVCEPPRYTSMSGTVCTDCNLDNCAQCQNATACKTCDDTYKLWNGICVLAECGVANCSACAAATTCSTCDTGLTLSADGKTCGCGVENCDYCGGAHQCNVCKSGFAPNTDGTLCVASTSTSSTTDNGGSGPAGTTGGGDGDSSNAAIVTGDSGDNSSTGGLSNGGIVGVVVGVAAFVLLVLIGGWVYVKYRASRAAKQAQQNAGGVSGSEENGSQDLSRSNESGSDDATPKKGSRKGSAASAKKASTGSKKDAGSASKSQASGTGSQKKASAATKGSKKDAGSVKKGTKKVVEISGSAELESMSADQLSGSAE